LPTEYNIRMKLRGAYAIDQDLLEVLVVEAAKLTGGEVSISFSLQGEETIESDNLLDLISDSSLGVKYIRNVEIRSSKYGEYRTSITLRIGSKYLFDDAAEISLAGNKAQVTAAIRECCNRLDAACTPYSIFYLAWNTATKVVMATILLLIVAYFKIYDLRLTIGDDLNNALLSVRLVLNFIGIYFMLGIVDVFLEYFFPQIFFKFGKNGISYNRRIKALAFVFSTIIVASIVGYFINRFSR
jgi:hypothetical protein